MEKKNFWTYRTSLAKLRAVEKGFMHGDIKFPQCISELLVNKVSSRRISAPTCSVRDRLEHGTCLELVGGIRPTMWRSGERRHAGTGA